MFEQVERFFRLREQIRQLRRLKPPIKDLHLSPSGKTTNPVAATMEKAYLMQVRLALEASVDSVGQGRSGPHVNERWDPELGDLSSDRGIA